MPKLSFIVPIYNTAPFLPRCLDSILNQSFSDYEILAIDDGSTDESGKILSQWQKKSEKLRVFQKENGGLSLVRNFGIEKAEGEFIAFVDSDDFLHPMYAEKMIAKMEQEGLDLLFCDFFFHFSSEKTVPVSSRKFFLKDNQKASVIAPPMAWLRMYRKSLFLDTSFREGLFCEDLELIPSLCLKTDAVAFLEEGLYYYHQREKSIMSSPHQGRHREDIFTAAQGLLRRFSEAGKKEEYHSELEFLFIEHLLRSAALRFAKAKEDKDLFFRLLKFTRKYFPHWEKNPYLPRTSLFFRLCVFLTAKGCRQGIKLLSKWKG
jgi:glycosyltransferase involved in cell wall biosynthesis